MLKRIYQFKIVLKEITPTVWRRIQVPETYSFWDLHVAIQDAMGWLDYHLHAFRVYREHLPGALEIGIPNDYAVVGDPKIAVGSTVTARCWRSSQIRMMRSTKVCLSG